MTRRLVISLVGLLVVVFGSLAGNLVADNKPALGLDLQGGISVTQEPVGEYDSVSLDLAVERIRDRVDSLGVAEPEIIRQGDAIVVNLPGVDNQDEALRLVQVTGAVLLRPVLLAQPISPIDTSSTTVADGSSTTTVDGSTTSLADGSSTTTVDGSSTTAPVTTLATSTTAPGGPSRQLPQVATSVPTDDSTTVPSTDSTLATPGTEIPLGAEAPTGSDVTSPTPPAEMGDPADPTATIIVQNTDGSEIYQLGPSFATGEVFNNDAQADIISGGWGVRVTLKNGAAGSDLWNIGAAQCYAKSTTCPTGRMAIVLDGVVQSAPSVNQPSFSGGVDITGNFKESEAKDLARVLKSGALPVRLEVQAVQIVSPTLGDDSLNAAIVSGLIGVLLVLLFMLLYYRLLALIGVFGITLSGLAGIIVSIGVTVDSYVVFFEKLKDELKSGRSLKNSAERGFKSAWRTILAADIVSLIGAFTLWYLTVGSVRGFAFFLGLSTLCDIVIAWFFTRPAMLMIARTKRFQRGRLFGIDNTVNATGGAA